MRNRHWISLEIEWERESIKSTKSNEKISRQNRQGPNGHYHHNLDLNMIEGKQHFFNLIFTTMRKLME